MPATTEDVTEAASYLISATEIGLPKKQRASEEEKQIFTRMLASYDYTRAELILAMREVPRDPERFGGRSASVQDVERVIKRSRKMRARLKQQLTAKARNELVAEYPDELSIEDFKCCGFNQYDEPLYRYAPDVREHAGPPRPQLEEKAPPQREGEGQTTDLSGAVEEAIDDLEGEEENTRELA